MAACPYCSIEKGWLSNQAYCSATSNPSNAARIRSNGPGNYYTQNGVAYDKCVNGNPVAGMTIKDCPFFKKG